MHSLFHHNHHEPNGSFTGPLKTDDIANAVTLHPLKNHTYQYRMYAHLGAMRSQELRHRTLRLHREIHDMDQVLRDRPEFFSPNRLGLVPSLLKYKPQTRADVIPFEFMNAKSMFSQKTANPKPGLDVCQKEALEQLKREAMREINGNPRQRGRLIEFNLLLYGYRQVNPLFGANYIVDYLLRYHKHKGRKMSIPVRRHAYLHQAFSEIEFREDPLTVNASLTSRAFKSWRKIPQYTSDYSEHVTANESDPMSDFRAPADEHTFELRDVTPNMHYDNKVLYFIMSLAGRFDTFLTFMTDYEDVILRREKRSVLSIMLYKSKTDDRTEDMFEFVSHKQEQYPQHELRVHRLSGEFNRGGGLEAGSNLHSHNALLVFIDVDMVFNVESVQRIKLNTVQGRQVYFPIVFSQYDPALTNCAECDSASSKMYPFRYGDTIGYWRSFGFGIAAMYNSDFKAVGGFDKIVGWGKEDVVLFEKYVSHNLTLFRAPEPGLVHVYHPIHCDPSLEQAQYESCVGTKASTYASQQYLSDYVFRTPELLYRNENPPNDSNNIVKMAPVDSAPLRHTRRPGS